MSKKKRITDDNRAVIYVRVSTMQVSQKDSPEHQKALCLEKARMEGLDVIHVYEDRSSGTSINERDDIKQMISDAENGNFQHIIFASLSRFSRDSLDALTLKRILVDRIKIRLISIEDTYDSMDKDDEMIFTIISAVNQKLSEQISVASRRGIRESAKSGNFTGSKAPFGYKKVRIENGNKSIKSLRIVEEDAKIVQTIFHKYVNENMGDTAIVNYLNDEAEIPSPKGGKWGITTIQRILQNEAYTGRNVFGKYTIEKRYEDSTNIQNKTKVLVQRDKGDWDRNQQKNWEAIIDDETFQKAREIRQLRGGGKRGGARNIKVNAFTGLIECAECGSAMVSQLAGKTGKQGQKYRYLICSQRRRQGKNSCENALWVPYYDFQDQILKKIKGALKELVNVSEIASTQEILIKEERDIEKEIKEIEKRIDGNRKLLFELRKEFKTNEIDKDQFEFEKAEYANEIEECKKKLKKLQDKQESTINESAIKEEINQALTELVNLDYNDATELKTVLQKVIEKIKIDKDAHVEVITPLGVLA